jgi:Uma2 family endonuclease
MKSAATSEPTWEIAHLFPSQGSWTEEEYLALETNHLVEFSNGFIEVLPMPTTSHQMMVAYLYGLVLAFVSTRNLGTVLFAPLRIRLKADKFREPDIAFMLKENADQITDGFWSGADLVMEVVSGTKKDRRRDLVVKRKEYAKAGIAEYWIIDPEEERITVLRLSGKRYVVHGNFDKGAQATSHLLPGLSVNVPECLSQRLPSATGKNGRKRKR